MSTMLILHRHLSRAMKVLALNCVGGELTLASQKQVADWLHKERLR
jgi:hypothetical protein